MNALAPFILTTATGMAFNLAEPDPDMVALADIVHHLSRQPAHGGNYFMPSYFLAQRSLILATACRLPKSRPYALLFHASQAYRRTDADAWTRWLIACGGELRMIETRILRQAIFPRFGLPMPGADVVTDLHNADQVTLATECRDILRTVPRDLRPAAKPLGSKIKFRPPLTVEDDFQQALTAALRPFGKVD
jgi:hypothetical protein